MNIKIIYLVFFFFFDIRISKLINYIIFKISLNIFDSIDNSARVENVT